MNRPLLPEIPMPDQPLPPPTDPGPILVTGATGKLGRIVTRDLIARGLSVRVLTRDPAAARALFGQAPEILRGDFADPASLLRAVAGAERLFLLSPIRETMAAEQIAVIDAARQAGVGRVVKISGSDWTVGTSFSGDAHKAVEDHLARHIPDSVAIRPNAWAQVSLGPQIDGLRAGGPLRSRHGGAAVAYIDIRDIADVAVAQLLAPRAAPGPLVITGGESLTAQDVAALAAHLTGRPVAVAGADPLAPDPLAHVPAFERGVIAQFMTVIAAGGAAGITDTVAQVLGRPPRRIADYLAETLGPVPQRA